MTTSVPALRVHPVHDAPLRPERRFVLYWMVAARRGGSSFALDHAADLARELDRPLLVLEPLRAGYRWASDRFHRFVIEGMRDNGATFEGSAARYVPYVEPAPGAGRGLLAALAAQACVVVTDEFPCFFVPRMQAAAARALDVRLDVVDGCGLLPLRDLPAADRGDPHGPRRRFHRAVDFRRHLQKRLERHLGAFPRANGLAGLVLRDAPDVPRDVARRWPEADLDALLTDGGLAGLPIDHDVRPVASTPGGRRAGLERLDTFLASRLPRYDERNQPEAEVTSGLSPYLHFGHVGPHEVVRGVLDVENWTPDHVASRATGSRSGWWGVSPAAEGFLDQVVTWRELCFHTCHVLPDAYDRYEGLPDWARRTLEEHADDPREPLYTERELDEARTHDALWNAAQNQLREQGVIHNYLRMLWGKKVLEWTPSPREALRVLVELNNRYALDGRDPNSYGGIFWVLGRHDRAWGPEREVFGKIRYMSSENTARKVRVRDYVARFADGRG